MIWTTGETWMTVPQSVCIRLTGRFKKGVIAKDLAFHILGTLGPETVHGMALEFIGDGLEQISIHDRFMMCNLSVETGAKFAIMPVDNVTRQYLQSTNYPKDIAPVVSDSDTEYAMEFAFDLGEVVPMVAAPYMPTAVMTVASLQEIPVDQVVIGSCTSGRIEDFRLVAGLLENHELSHRVRLGLFPSSHQAVRDIVDEGLALFFTRKGASISPPSCQPCLGSGPSLLGENEIGIYTTNRNYRGRHGPASAKVFLSGPLVATASAITGVITDPRELLSD
jgi:3-isopropylmalate/(R)-2-methylmalate dehydratase large subunit